MKSNIEINPNKEYILGGDISFSMTTEDPKCGNQTRYKYMLEKFSSFIKQSEEFDPHGPTVILFGQIVHTFKHTTLSKIATQIEQVNFEPFTNLHLAIKEAYKIHREEKSELASEGKLHPGTIFIVFTDGEPTNQTAVKDCIVNIANEIDREEEFNILLLTVGTISQQLKQFLDSLHDDLESRISRDFDIVHVKQLEEVDFLMATNAKNEH